MKRDKGQNICCWRFIWVIGVCWPRKSDICLILIQNICCWGL